MMQRLHRVRALLAGTALASVAVVGVALPGAVAGAQGQPQPRHHGSSGGISDAVFVQTNGTNGNQILAYSRSSTGALSFEHAYSTGGLGFRETGSVVDPLASQGSLYYDPAGALLIAVNAGSDTITSFRVSGDTLSDRQVLWAGHLPVSVTSNGPLVYVLDAGGAGAVRGFFEFDGQLFPILGSRRGLGLNPDATPQYLNTPGQVGFSPGGNQLIVTTKDNGSDIDVFAVRPDGRLSDSPVENASAEPVPFGFVFDPAGRLVVTEAGGSDVSTYTLNGDGTITHLSTVADGQTAPCWIASADGYYFVANAGSADIAAYQVSSGGIASLITENGGIATTTDAGPIDLATSSDGQFLYVEAGGAGAVDEFSINSDGTLTEIGSVTGLSGTGIEGIVAA
jgi:6-phosphogluconolactonase (cycloisomerase 2 family)